MSSSEIIRGITTLDTDVHVSTGRYPSLGNDVEVIEIEHDIILKHLGDRLPVFSRLISTALLEQRVLDYSNDQTLYKEEQLKNL